MSNKTSKLLKKFVRIVFSGMPVYAQNYKYKQAKKLWPSLSHKQKAFEKAAMREGINFVLAQNEKLQTK